MRWPDDFSCFPGVIDKDVWLGSADFDERQRYKTYFLYKSDAIVHFVLKGDEGVTHVKHVELRIGEYPVWEADDVPLNTPIVPFMFPGIPTSCTIFQEKALVLIGTKGKVEIFGQLFHYTPPRILEGPFTISIKGKDATMRDGFLCI